MMTFLNGEKISCKSHELCLWWIGSWFLQKGVERFNLMNKSTWHCVTSSKKLMKRLKYITKEFWKWQIAFNIRQMKVVEFVYKIVAISFGSTTRMKQDIILYHKEVAIGHEKMLEIHTTTKNLLEPLTPQNISRTIESRKIDLICAQCKKPGHVKEKCHWNLDNSNKNLKQKSIFHWQMKFWYNKTNANQISIEEIKNLVNQNHFLLIDTFVIN